MTSTSPRDIQYYDEFASEYALFFADLPQNMEEEGAWLDDILRRSGARTVLDASCGMGRHLIPLARRGYTITGADPSRAMLQEAQKRAKALGLSIPLIPCAFADLRSTFEGHFDAVIALGNSLCNQETRTEVVDALAAMRACLEPHGICIIGIKDFDTIRRERVRFHGHSVNERDGERTVLFETWDIDEPLLTCTAYSLRGQGDTWRVHSASTHEYMVGPDECVGLAQEAGFAQAVRLDHPSEVVFALYTTAGTHDDPESMIAASL